MTAKLTFEGMTTSALNEEMRLALVALASATRPPAPPSYVEPRLATYGEVLIARDARGPRAFALLDRFVRAGVRYVYVGPFFSGGGAGVALFCELVRRELTYAGPGPDAFCLAAEVQNLFALATMKALLPETSFPHEREGRGVPESVQEAAAVFAAALPHVGALDRARLVTTSSGSLFRRRPLPAGSPLRRWEEWLARRAVDFTAGDSQMILLPCLHEDARAPIRSELAAGLRALSGEVAEDPRGGASAPVGESRA